MSLNHIDIMGRITRDIEVRTTANNVTIANFPVAVDRDYQSGNEKQTDFIDIVAFNHTASFVEKWFKKGQMIAVSGRLQSRKWQDKNGNNRVSWEVVADSVYFCGKTELTPVNVQFEDLPEEGELPF